jgi:hypothetical protein
MHVFYLAQTKGFQGMAEANIIDPTWVLSEETGRLRIEGLRRVRRNPRQKLVIEHVSETVTREWIRRYQRIAADRRNRGIDHG